MSALGSILDLAAALLASPVLYLAFFAFASLRRAAPEPPKASPRRLLVVLPAYREDAVIVASAAAAASHDYPVSAREVVVVADRLRPETLERLRRLPVRVLEVAFENSTKVRALRAALETIPVGAFDGIVVLDADNIMASGFLRRASNALAAGCVAAQGQRVAKNVDTPLELLDAVSEAVNNRIFRRGHRAAGLSAALIGSGMVFETELFRAAMSNAEAVGGFDKELELWLLARGVRIEYLENARVRDEKVGVGEDFVIQRRRWLSAQAHYARSSFGRGLAALLGGRFDLANKVAHTLLPPRALLLLLLPAGTSAALIAGSALAPWLALDLVFAAALAVVFPWELTRGRFSAALAALPRALVLFARSFAGIRGANRRFLHTPHGRSAAPLGGAR